MHNHLRRFYVNKAYVETWVTIYFISRNFPLYLTMKKLNTSRTKWQAYTNLRNSFLKAIANKKFFFFISFHTWFVRSHVKEIFHGVFLYKKSLLSLELMNQKSYTHEAFSRKNNHKDAQSALKLPCKTKLMRFHLKCRNELLCRFIAIIFSTSPLHPSPAHLAIPPFLLPPDLHHPIPFHLMTYIAHLPLPSNPNLTLPSNLHLTLSSNPHHLRQGRPVIRVPHIFSFS